MKKREKSFIYYILVGLVCITIIVAFIFGEKVVLFTATIILTIFAFWGDNISNFKFLDKLSALIRTIINKILEITLKNLENYSDSIRKILPPKDNNVYHDLAPVDDVSGKSGYFRALDWALNNKKICNIAISAPYGAGKSSVINSYINNRKIKALQISLTNFSGTAMKPNEIEKAFLEKLFYKVKNSRIPESRFRKLHRISNIKVLINILLLITLSNHEDIIENILSKETFRVLSLSSEQVRLLYSLELVATTKDIEHTVNQKTKEKKQMWLNSWKELIVSGIGLNVDDYYVTDEKLIYDAINSIPQTVDNLRCFYLVTSEFIAYTPYFPLNSREDAEYKKLRLEKYNYIDDQFSRKQTIVSQAEIDGIRNSYKKYKGLVSGNTQNAMIAAGVVTVTAAVTGGLALTFAPGIATLIAGEAVAGLHGAALTSASLAFVGGGSLAAGGLGMAGGTAIITGGGTLLGVAGSSSASIAVILSQTNNQIWLELTTNLLVFCKCVLKERLKDIKALEEVVSEVNAKIGILEKFIKELEDDKCSLDEEIIKRAKYYLKCLNRCRTELKKML